MQTTAPAPSRSRWWESVREGLLGLIYPRVCVGCEAPLVAGAGIWLCEECTGELKPIEPPYCDTCGQPFAGMMAQGFRCANCADLDLAFDFAVAGYHAEGLARDLIHQFKYERQHFLCALLGELLRETLNDPRLRESGNGDWILTPVPLHPRRFREREFNQAAELARTFRREGHGSGFEIVNALRRTRYTRRQANLDRADRLTNLRDAFAVRDPDLVRGRQVLLVDDVLTTGATASECARVLREDGEAAKVVVITVVRG